MRNAILIGRIDVVNHWWACKSECVCVYMCIRVVWYVAWMDVCVYIYNTRSKRDRGIGRLHHHLSLFILHKVHGLDSFPILLSVILSVAGSGGLLLLLLFIQQIPKPVRVFAVVQGHWILAVLQIIDALEHGAFRNGRCRSRRGWFDRFYQPYVFIEHNDRSSSMVVSFLPFSEVASAFRMTAA